jgi:hypothetical protein
MTLFLRVAAVVVALGNQYAPIMTGANPADIVEYVRSHGWSLLQPLPIAIAAALLTAEVLIRLMRPLLEGGFLARYAAMVLAVCLGWMLYGALLAFLAGAIVGGEANLYDIVPGVIERILSGLVLGFLGVIFGGVIGLVEGLVLGFPLAAILGLFKNRH